MQHISYNTGTSALPDIYALALGRCEPLGVMRIYQAKHSCLCYNLYITSRVKSLCCLLWIFETRIAVTIMTNQHQHHDCEEDIMMFDIIEIIAQLHRLVLLVLPNVSNFATICI